MKPRPGSRSELPAITDAMPHADDLERGLLGRLIRSGRELVPVTHGLRSLHFFGKRNRLIHDAILDLHRAGFPIDLITVTNRLRESGKLDDAGGTAFVSAIEEQACSSGSVTFIASKLRALAACRALAALGTSIQSTVLLADLDPKEALHRCRTLARRATIAAAIEPDPFRLRAWKACEILAGEFPPLLWDVQGENRLLLPSGTVGTLFGWGGLGKSLLAMEMGISLAAGLPWLGIFQVRQCPVLYVDFEGVPLAHLRERVQWICEALQVDPKDLPFYIMSAPTMVLGPETQEEIAREVRRRGAKWTFIDSATTALLWDEADPVEVTRRFKDTIFPIRDTGTGVTLIDHSRKPGAEGGRNTGDSQHDLRGTTAKLNAVDFAIGLSAKETTEGEIITFTCAKARLGPRWFPFVAKVKPIFPTGRRLVFAGDAEPNERPAPKSSAIKSDVREILGVRRDLTQMDLTVALENREHKTRTIEDALAEMVASGELEKSPSPKDRRTFLVWLKKPSSTS